MRLIDIDLLKKDLDTINPIYKDIIFWFNKILDSQPIIRVEIPIQIIEYIGDNDNGNKSNN